MKTSKTPTTRISTTFSADAVAWLEREAGRRAITVSELLRRIVDELRLSFIVPKNYRG